eukprot:UN25030
MAENRDFLPLLLLKIEHSFFFSMILQIAKNLSKQAMILIFFPVKAESPYFSNLEKGSEKGAGESQF